MIELRRRQPRPAFFSGDRSPTAVLSGIDLLRLEWVLGVTTAMTTYLGRYTVDSEIGQGGQGIVYRGHDSRLGKMVALKVLSRPRRSPPIAKPASARRRGRLRS
ncbi:MAG: hypothetical protein HXY20_00510 [Acidobacteria bacterium]|nr:hypothetical protein [Acidobacteriota bacterium]